MGEFWFRLLDRSFIRKWLFQQTETLVNSDIIDVSEVFQAKLVSTDLQKLLNMHFLACPVGVVNDVLLGYVLGDPCYFALPEDWSDGVHPNCRRFVFDTKNMEFLEFHWYSESDRVLISWQKFLSECKLTSYFVLYHAQNTERLPHMVLRSTKMVMEKKQDEIEEASSSNQTQTTRILPETLEERLEELPTVREFVRSLIGVFYGSLQISEVNREGNLVTLSYSACEVHMCHIPNAEELKKRERRRYSRKELFGKIPILRSVEPLQAMNKLLLCTVQNQTAGKKIQQFDINDSRNIYNNYTNLNNFDPIYLPDANFSIPVPSLRMRQRSTNMEYENNSMWNERQDNENKELFSLARIDSAYKRFDLDGFLESSETLATELKKNDSILDLLGDYSA